jgi:hypothetical protein
MAVVAAVVAARTGTRVANADAGASMVATEATAAEAGARKTLS